MTLKKRLGLGCLILSACLASVQAAADKTYKSIKYDFLMCKTDVSCLGGFTIPHGQGLRLHVEYFNPFLYDIAVNQQTVSYNQTIPTLISAALAGSAPGITETGKPQKVKPNPILEAFENAIIAFQKALSDAYTQIAAAERIVLESIGYSDDLKQDELIQEITASLSNICAINPPSPSINPSTPDELKLVFSSFISNVVTAWDRLDAAYNRIAEEVDKQTAKESLELEKGRYLVFQRTDRATLENALNNAVSAWRALEEAKFETWAGPFFADGDELIIKITATRKLGLDARFPTKRACLDKPIVRLLTKGGVKVDFSTGFVFEWRRDRVYNLQENSIVRNKSNEAWSTVGPGAFIHIYPRQERNIKFAGTFGVTISKTNIFNYYFGPSILFGASQRGVITVGCGVRSIATLSGEYQEGDILPEDIGIIPLANVPKFSMCVGFSFNFGGL